MERTSATSHVGNIYKGRVTNVEPSIQAAFVDFGLGRNGFLHISDLMPSYFGRRGDDYQESVGRKMARRDRPPIQRCLRRGDDIIVQIIKEGIGTKGPTLSTYLSIPGRILVMMPGMSKLGVSRKIEDEEERRRLRQILDVLKPPKDCGFIIRTAGVGKTKAEIQKDLNYLTRLWQNISKTMSSEASPVELYTEGDLVTRTVRDVFTADIERIIVDHKDVASRIKDFIKIAMPRTKNRLELYEEPVPLFHKYGIEREIELMYARTVPLPSGGSLVIDSTEAVVAIDVNSGKFRDHSDAEMTAFKTDMEAADEIPRQLRLRDLGGVIICDFIDLRYERHRRDLEKRLHENLRNDRAKTKMLRMSQFGIIEMTRQRMRPSLKRSIYFDCPHCRGAGLVKTPESMALDVMRRLAIAINDQRVHRIELAVCPEVTFYLQNRKRTAIAGLESHYQKRIIIRSDPAVSMDEVSLQLFDARDGLIYLESLGMAPPSALPQRGHQRGGQADRRDQRGRRDHDRGRRDRGGRPVPEERDEREDREERYDIDAAEDAVDDREAGGIQHSAASATIEEPPAELEEDAGQSEAAALQAPEMEDEVMAPPPNEQPEVAAEAQERGRHRSRGRRGRGGRSRGRGDRETLPPVAQQAAPPPMAAPQIAPQAKQPEFAMPPVEEVGGEENVPAGAEAAPAGQDVEPEGKPKRRRGHRGGRGRGRKKAVDTVEAADAAAGAEQPAAVIQPRPAVVQEAVAARAGGSDRHLVRDEPVLPQPVHRPRTYRDLDTIPDDFD
jgi:ribonuclease E